jgi:hypothetical protein
MSFQGLVSTFRPPSTLDVLRRCHASGHVRKGIQNFERNFETVEIFNRSFASLQMLSRAAAPVRASRSACSNGMSMKPAVTESAVMKSEAAGETETEHVGRCDWVKALCGKNAAYVRYHDEEWGVCFFSVLSLLQLFTSCNLCCHGRCPSTMTNCSSSS